MFSSRMARDHGDAMKVVAFLKERRPFSQESNILQNICTGETSNDKVTVLDTFEIGTKVLNSMEDSNALEYSFRKKNQVITMCKAPKIIVGDEEIQVDPDLLYQRLVTMLSMKGYAGLQEALKTEMCVYPQMLFESPSSMLPACKYKLADTLWAMYANAGNNKQTL